MEKEVKSWEQLAELIASSDQEGIHDYMDENKSEDIIHAFSHLNRAEQNDLLGLMSAEDGASLLERIPQSQAVQLIEDVETETAASILNQLYSDEQVDIISELDDDDAHAILEEMYPKEAENIRRLIHYDSDCAGGVMITEYLAFECTETVGEITTKLRDNSEEYEDYNVQYIYVVDDGVFVGVLQMRDLLLSKASVPLSKIVIKNALTVKDTDHLTELISFFDKYDFYGVPVVNDANILLGIVMRKHVREAENDRFNTELLETQGIVGGEELRTMPVMLRSRRRLSWLSVNILLNIIAASVIAFYQDTLQEVIALAVFLPVISDMSGCSGNQAVAVSLRELSLGVVKPYELMRVLWQEVKVGLINGVVLGALIGLAAFFWQGNAYLGLVVGGALAINTVVAVAIGGTIPLFLKKMKVDPALASGPILTTVTDMLGFFLALTFAGLALAHLV
ncbi:magnesium transporter [Roseivirga ehrenbergii]|uniref:Magnesium transporter MgtE n=1 Tax=Roseivirga ehrenbergii (strain DSM 102268 / JCM 13514 / KCTC 12282 / NCIMB 14502 / KMM 6017) TaxID=279360 RepID=A0A150XN81_ROSEK|nr:magnesium transporter [Roseivirga ehrenbergii]KYG80190.1 magnesium transporter [Roseivirga ehrenbergii]TCK99221.1 magnesium transporter [Roseivirga ehrenbergii]